MISSIMIVIMENIKYISTEYFVFIEIYSIKLNRSYNSVCL